MVKIKLMKGMKNNISSPTQGLAKENIVSPHFDTESTIII